MPVARHHACKRVWAAFECLDKADSYMFDSSLLSKHGPVLSGRKSVLTARFLVGILVALGLLVYATLATSPAQAADESAFAGDNRLDRRNAPSQQSGQSGIASPATGSSVSGSVPVIGTAAGPQFARYELYFKLEPSGDEAFVWFAGETFEVNNGQLGVWHTGNLAPGIYSLRLRVVRPDGNYGEFFARDISVNQDAPTPTPDGPTPTPIPIDTPTPVPQPTVPPVEIVQPEIEEPTVEVTPSTAAPSKDNGGGTTQEQTSSEGQSIVPGASGSIGSLAEALSLNRMRERFFTGVRWSAGLFLLLGAVFAAKRLLQWMTGKI